MDAERNYTPMDTTAMPMHAPMDNMRPYYTNGAVGNIMQEPYNEEYQHPYPEEQYVPKRATGGTNQRMLIMLVWAVAMASIAVAFIGPRIGIGEGENTGILNNVVEAVIGEPIVAQPATGNSGGISPVFSPEVQHWGSRIVQWAAQNDLDPDMVATVMQIESCGDPGAESWAGAQGLFQVMPFHFAAGEDMKDPDTNAKRGMAYLAERLVQTGGETGHAFAGYNGGHGASATNYDSWVAETQAYYRWSTGIYQDAKDGRSSSDTLTQWLNAGGRSLCNSAANRLGLR